jgi:uncharacterized membrane protein/thiol-disulfide isomerase/thioredoxin
LKTLHWKFIILIIGAWLVFPSAAATQSREEPVIQAVLFYSPTCPHCHHVITEVLIPMVEEYGSDKLQIIGIDTSQPAGAQLYQATIERYQIPPHRVGVPTLVVGETVLVGSAEIPEVFPDLVTEALSSDGISWPGIPGLEEVIPPEVEGGATPTPGPQLTSVPDNTAAAEPTITPATTATAFPNQAPTATPAPTSPALTLSGEEVPALETEEPPPDPAGFALASVVLLGMVVAIVYVGWRLISAWPRLFQLDRSPRRLVQTWLIPILALLGLGIAVYLAYVEITHIEAICGPVGECNVVQASPYARILGIPVAVLGLLNYMAVIVLWAGQKIPGGRWANLSALGLLGLTLFGTLFSIYLTCLELFVIRAVCAWCLSSAVVTTLLMLLAAFPITRQES